LELISGILTIFQQQFCESISLLLLCHFQGVCTEQVLQNKHQ
jgi:hypothetical protein